MNKQFWSDFWEMFKYMIWTTTKAIGAVLGFISVIALIYFITIWALEKGGWIGGAVVIFIIVITVAIIGSLLYAKSEKTDRERW